MIRRPNDRARPGRRSRRGQHLREAARRLEARCPQPLVGHRLQPPEPRRGGFRWPLPSLTSVSTLEIIAFNRGSPAQYGGTRPRRVEAVCRARGADGAPSRAGCGHADAGKAFCEGAGYLPRDITAAFRSFRTATPGHPEPAGSPSPLTHPPQQRGPIAGCRLRAKISREPGTASPRLSLEDTSPPWSADAARPECGHYWRRPRDSEPPGHGVHPGPMCRAAENHSGNPS